MTDIMPRGHDPAYLGQIETDRRCRYRPAWQLWSNLYVADNPARHHA